VRPRSSSVRAIRAALIAVIASLAVVGCAGDETVQGEGPVTVYVSLPLRGPSGADGQDAADAAELALTDAGGEAAGREVRAIVLDDTEGPSARASWTPEQAAANARQATEDSTSIAYIGDFESGATRSSLPITNEARLLQVSPASSAVDLVAPFPGSDDVPDVQPSGERTFGRVIPNDYAQGQAAAVWVSELGWKPNITIDRDGSAFGHSLAEGFKAGSEEVGLVLQGGGGVTHTYHAGDTLFGAGIARQAAEQGLDLAPNDVASDLYLPPYDPRSGSFRLLPLYVTSAALDPSQLPPAGQEFLARFRSEYGREPGRYAAYGYEAMAVVLDAIERASDGGTDREAVIDAFLETSDRDSVLGTYSIDEVGETSLNRLTGYQVEDDRARPVAELSVP
jgi:branched-chain amino acid transport system substrate-binding protein